jgi:hypothetical protein
MRLFVNAYSDLTNPKNYYMKFFWKNTNSTLSLINALATGAIVIGTIPVGERGFMRLFVNAYSGRPGNHVEVAHLAREAHKGGGRVVAAWGALGGTPDLQRLLRERRDALLPLLDGIPLWCLGKTQDGSPRHPSRLGYGVPMERWR